jgi:hypothetical protein
MDWNPVYNAIQNWGEAKKQNSLRLIISLLIFSIPHLLIQVLFEMRMDYLYPDNADRKIE